MMMTHIIPLFPRKQCILEWAIVTDFSSGKGTYYSAHILLCLMFIAMFSITEKKDVLSLLISSVFRNYFLISATTEV